MHPSQAPSRPAAAPALALLAGVVLGAARSAPTAWPLVAGVLLLLGCVTLGGRARPAHAGWLACGALLALGGWIEHTDRQVGRDRVADLLDRPGSVARLHLRGELLGLPEPAVGGERWIRLRARPESEREGRAPAIRVLLRVGRSAPEATRALDALGVGDRVRVWCRIRRPRPHGNPAASDPQSYLRGAGLDAIGTVKSARLIECLERRRAGPQRWIERFKRAARWRLDRIAAGRPQTRAVLGAMLLGDRAALSPDTRHRLRASGLVHLLAISGLHVALIMLGLLGLLRRAGCSAWLFLLPVWIGLWGFGVCVGSRPSVSRAALIVMVLVFGRCLGREGNTSNTLALAAATLVLFRPGILWDAGFQLSFLATGGILVHGHALARRLPLSRLLAAPLAVSVCAYLATAPVVATILGGLAPVGILTNLVAAPLCALILFSGYGSILLHGLPWIGDLSAWCCTRAVEALLAIGEAAAAGGLLGVGPPSPALLLLFYASVLLVEAGGRQALRPGRLGLLTRESLLLLYLLCAAWLHHGALPPGRARGSEARLVDVGQGQCVVIRGPTGGVFLVDAGGSGDPRFDPGRRVVLPSLRLLGLRRLEALIVTHGDADHAAGAFALLHELEVGELWMGPGWHREPRLAALGALAVERGTALRMVERGERGDLAGLALRVLGPGRGQLQRSSNDRSLVLLIGASPTRLLIPGDLEVSGERDLLGSAAGLRAELLVLAHHGSRRGSGGAFLDRVAPMHAVVSSGWANRFGHPHREVIERLRSRGVALWRTDLQGMIVMHGSAAGWSIRAHGAVSRGATE